LLIEGLGRRGQLFFVFEMFMMLSMLCTRARSAPGGKALCLASGI
jgi:hypothetical protein